MHRGARAIHRECPRQPINRALIVLSLQRAQPEQLQSVEIPWLARQHLPAHRIRLEQTALTNQSESLLNLPLWRVCGIASHYGVSTLERAVTAQRNIRL